MRRPLQAPLQQILRYILLIILCSTVYSFQRIIDLINVMTALSGKSYQSKGFKMRLLLQIKSFFVMCKIAIRLKET